MKIAVLMRPSGKVQARVEVEDLPPELHHDGERWKYSHRTERGAAYQLVRGRGAGAGRDGAAVD